VLNNFDLTVRKAIKLLLPGITPLLEHPFSDSGRGTETDSGSFRWGVTITSAYFPRRIVSSWARETLMIGWVSIHPHWGWNVCARFLRQNAFFGREAWKNRHPLRWRKVRCICRAWCWPEPMCWYLMSRPTIWIWNRSPLLMTGWSRFPRWSCLPHMTKNLSPPLPTGLSKSLRVVQLTALWFWRWSG